VETHSTVSLPLVYTNQDGKCHHTIKFTDFNQIYSQLYVTKAHYICTKMDQAFEKLYKAQFELHENKMQGTYSTPVRAETKFGQ
jgi:predicted choloylglycine hydrolase